MPRGDAVMAGSPAHLAALAPVVLGDLTLHPPTCTVGGPAGSVSVEPRIMQVLIALAAQPETVVSRDMLLERCWPGMVVGDDSLHRAIAGARRALRESGAGACVETIPRIGYRLLAGAVGVAQTLPPEPGVTGDASRAPVPRRWLLASGLAAVTAGGWAWRKRHPPRLARVDALLASAANAARLAEPDADRQGVGVLREAARLAPDDALVWGRLALGLHSVAEYAPAPRVIPALAAAEAAARQALALDPGQPDARTALVLATPIHGNWHRVEQGLVAILTDAPDHLPALDWLSQVQAGAGLVRKHYPARLRTVALDPLHAGYNFRSIYAHWMNGNLAAADDAGSRGMERWPRHLATFMARSMLFAFSGRPERALPLLTATDPAPPVPPAVAATLVAVAQALQTGRDADRARAFAALDQSISAGGPLMAVTACMALAALGDAHRALSVTEAFLLERGPVMAEPVWRPGEPLHNDVHRRFTNYLFTPVMAPVRALPGFADIVRDIGLVEYWRESGSRPDYLGGGPLP